VLVIFERPLLSFSLLKRNELLQTFRKHERTEVYIPQLAAMNAVLLYCIIAYFVSAVGLPSCFEQREILIVVTFCLFLLLCPIALLARIAMSGFFRTELKLERCSLDICKNWEDRPITRLLPPNTHTHTQTHTRT